MGILSGIVFIPAMHIGKFNRKARLIQVLVVAPIMLAVFIVPYVVFYSVSIIIIAVTKALQSLFGKPDVPTNVRSFDDFLIRACRQLTNGARTADTCLVCRSFLLAINKRSAAL